MKQRNLQDITITRTGINGEGIGTFNRKTVFVPHALVGEKVRVKITDVKKRYMRAELVKVLEPSSSRVKRPSCRIYEHCGGCAFMSMNYVDQLRVKRDMVRETLTKYEALGDANIKPLVAPDKSQGYRHEVRYPIRFFDGRVRFGIFQRDTHYFALMSHCPLQTQAITRVLTSIEKILGQCHAHDYNDKTRKGLRFITVRDFDDAGVQVMFVTGDDGLGEDVIKAISRLDDVTSLWYSVNTARYQDFSEKGYKCVYGKKQTVVNGHRFSVGADVPLFPAMDAKRQAILKEMIDPESTVLFLNAGNALDALSLDNALVALDASNANIEDAKKDPRASVGPKVFVKGEGASAIKSQCRKHDFDTFVIDLERDAMDEDMIDSLRAVRPARLILIAGTASAAAKSAASLTHYGITDVRTLDAEPYTARTQIVMALERL